MSAVPNVFCVDHISIKKYSVILLLQRHPYVMLPVDLKDNVWFDNVALQTLRVNELMRSKCFASALVLGISALIVILTSFTLSTVVIVLGINTAHFVDDLNKNGSLILARQQIVDKKLKAKLYALGYNFVIRTRERK